MPITVVVGGQFGSEGKGKVAHLVAKESGARYAVRVGGTNSGHTVVNDQGESIVFRHLPTASILKDVVSVIPPGHYIHVPTLLREIQLLQISPDRLLVDPSAWVTEQRDVEKELLSGIGTAIGSTTTGTGAALVRRIERKRKGTFAGNILELARYVRPTSVALSEALRKNERVVVEGTQGFGLSLLHSDNYPYCTSRDTTAAAFISEAGLSPVDVDDVVLVIRAFPIRVGGQSGNLPRETTWEEVTQQSGYPRNIVERTTVTNRVRRVAYFDANVVKRAIDHNRPTRIALNHVDYVDAACVQEGRLTNRAHEFVRTVETQIGESITYVGFGPAHLLLRDGHLRRVSNE